MRNAALHETRTVLEGLMHSASRDIFCLDPFAHVERACQKPLQLRVAQQVGLDVPDTLISNNPTTVRTFAAAHPEGLIAKTLASVVVQDGHQQRAAYTGVVTPEVLARLDALSLSPMTFQANIPKALELRVTMVGPHTFTAALDSQLSERAKVDWRLDGEGLIDAWQPYALPCEVETRLRQVRNYFGLHYGACDVILTPDGRYVFLEINPAGEFYWLEHHTGFPVFEAIAEVLVGHAQTKPRNSPDLSAKYEDDSLAFAHAQR